ncbi:PEGA domain-containing protein [Arenicella xantha]|uniref:Formylglycine-generating enzyme required for sulfatase activity n=1 Tax=Arenicella xantha TaxID=644221 RepID=A0A395JS17_9GAMM|nr:PEGA domain-containing protein [Arenicella xantha]RBP53236.1 formylglycine-generating enzyme required for sulfatase activity [Arenicella xantha]
MTKLDTSENRIIAPVDFQAPTGETSRARFKMTGTHWALIVIGFFSLLFITFISLAKSIELRAISASLNSPEKFNRVAANISISAYIKLPLGNRMLVLPGTYQVAVSADGYAPVSQSIDVSEQRHQQFELVLQRLPGALEIVLPEQLEAKVLVDGELAGSIPGVITGIPAGKRQITVDAPLFRPSTQSILVRGKGETQTLSMALVPAWAEYSFTSEPSGAAVIVDGELLGETPIATKLEEGTHELVIEAAKYKPFSQTIAVVAEQGLVIPTISLEPADGILELSSEPTGAAVVLNQQFKGVTPLSLSVRPHAEQSVKVYKAGFKLADQVLLLEPNQKQVSNVALEPDIINVRLSVSPADATVLVDGAVRGSGSQTLALNTLPHTISVRKPGYRSQTLEVVPTRTNQQLISINLLTEEQHYWAQVPAEYTNRVGHQMKLFKTLGLVKMGSSRRENGRRSNEVEYQAELTKPFYVAVHETTNKQFRAFKKTHNSGNYKGKSLDANKAPAVNISWQEAALYCNWLSELEGFDPFYQTVSGYVSGLNPAANGYRLLTEVEWAWLARNKSDGLLVYPWGASNTPATKVANFADQKAAELLAFTLADYDDGYRGPSPVGRFPENHRGLHDLAGNAAEWVNDWYSARGNTELGSAILKDPLGPSIGEFHVIRGASWAKGYLPQLRLAYRDYGAKGKFDVGFRVARYAGLNKSN